MALGYQLLATALGAKTQKLDRGTGAANQPVKDLTNGKAEITSQDHGFAVDDATLPEGVRVTHVSLFDGSNEGLKVVMGGLCSAWCIIRSLGRER